MVTAPRREKTQGEDFRVRKFSLVSRPLSCDLKEGVSDVRKMAGGGAPKVGEGEGG